MNAEENARAISPWVQVLLLAALLAPLLLLLFVPGRTPMLWLIIWFTGLLIFNVIVVWLMVRNRSAAAAVETGTEPDQPRLLGDEETPPVVREMLSIHSAIEDRGVRVFRGDLRAPAEEVYHKLKDALAPQFVPLVQQDPQLPAAVVLLPKPVGQVAIVRPIRLWVHWLLLGLTFLTTTWAGALQQGVNLLYDPGQFVVGLPYSIGLLAILGFHEMGHYLTARRYGMNVTPPYFIPVPFALGTFGAFIAMRSPAENRTSLFDVAVAGPLAGLVLAIPALLVGLQTSTIIAPGFNEIAPGGGLFGTSILFSLIAKTALGGKLLSGSMIQLSPLAFAGYLGLLVTALNLIPIGQLDGGHIARAMFGTRGGLLISRIAMWSLILLAIFVQHSLLFWALIVFFIARRAVPPQDDLTPVSKGRIWLGVLSFVILASILIPARL